MADEQQPQKEQPGSWTDWMTKPENQAAFIQMGAALMQPIGFGQTMSGHVGQAIGEGGEALTRNQAVQRAESKDARAADIEERKVATLEERAAAATTRANRAPGTGRGGAAKPVSLTSIFNQTRQDERAMRRAVVDAARRQAASDAAKAKDVLNPDPSFKPRTEQDYLADPTFVDTVVKGLRNVGARTRGSVSATASTNAATVADLDDADEAAAATPAAAPTAPVAASRPVTPNNMSQEQAIAGARAAIARGASKEAVIDRLRQGGFDPRGL